MACSGYLSPCFVNNDYVTAEIICIVMHLSQEILTPSGATLCCPDISAPLRKQQQLLLHHGCVHWVSHERREYSMYTAMAAASARRECCYGCCVSQERGCVVLGYTMATAKATASTRRE